VTMVVRTVVLAAACVGLSPGLVRSDEKLSIRVNPTMAMAPAFVIVRAVIAADQDNRALDVIAESDDFYTSSQVPLNGTLSPRMKEVRFEGLPAGEYQIRAILVGSQGHRAAVSQTLIVGGNSLRR
jgi:hypothetical protein